MPRRSIPDAQQARRRMGAFVKGGDSIAPRLIETDSPRPELVACLPGELLVRLTSALEAPFQRASCAQLPQFVRRQANCLIVADPLMENSSATDIMIALRRDYPSTTVVAYTTLRPEVVPHLLRLANGGLTEVVLFRHDDTRRRFADLIDQAAVNPIAVALLRELGPELERLPLNLRAVATAVFQGPLRYRAVSDIANDLGASRGRIYRSCHAAGIGSPRLLVASGRIVRAIAMLRDPARSVSETSVRLGYSRPEQLSEAIRSLTGIRARDIRTGVDDKTIARSIAARIRLADRSGHRCTTMGLDT